MSLVLLVSPNFELQRQLGRARGRAFIFFPCWIILDEAIESLSACGLNFAFNARSNVKDYLHRVKAGGYDRWESK
jgi:hypothetical protein